MRRRIPWQGIFFGIAILGLLFVVVKRASSGPPTIPTKNDISKAERTAVPKAGADERAAVPKGNFIAGNGLIEPADRETKVSANQPGRIQAFHVREGDFVEAAATLVELDNASEKAALEAAEGDLAATRAELARTARGLRKEDVDAVVADTESLKARAAISRTTMERLEQLARTGAATADELDRAKRQADSDARAVEAQEARRKAAVDGARAEDVVIAQARVQGATARRDQARAQHERTIVRAPIAGQVLQVKFRAGEFFNPNGTEPLVVLGDTRKLRVRMDVDERDIGKLKMGQGAFVHLNAYPGKRFPGKVVEIGRRMGRKNIRTDDPVERIDTKILEVLLELEPAEGLMPGLRVLSYVELG